MQADSSDLSTKSDPALLAMSANGDAQAMRTLTDRLAPRVLRFSLRMLGSRAEAEDVTQDTLLKLWTVAPTWVEGRAKVSTWMFQVARNQCIDILRRRRFDSLDAHGEFESGAASVEDTMIEAERRAALTAGLAQLPERQREAVILRHIEGLSNPEIGEILDISVEAVESLTARGKRSLATILSGQKQGLGL